MVVNDHTSTERVNCFGQMTPCWISECKGFQMSQNLFTLDHFEIDRNRSMEIGTLGPIEPVFLVCVGHYMVEIHYSRVQ